jgi:uncharacterized protein YyaL (SSP411 family)
VLADHGDLAGGLLALYQATGDRRWLDEGVAVIDQALAHFAERFAADGSVDGQQPWTGGFFDTADDAGPLIVRPRDPTDGAAPSGQSGITNALLTAAALTGNATYRACAEASLASVAGLVARFPRSAGWHLCAAEVVAAGPLQVAVSGDPGDERDALATVARRHAPAGSVIDIGMPDAPGRELLAARLAIGGKATAYVCRGFVCDRPVTAPADLQALLTTR